MDEKTFAPGDAPEASADARLSVAHADARRAKNPQSSSEQRPLAARSRITSHATFHPTERLKRTSRFRAIRQHGAWASGATLSVGVLPNAQPQSRLGIRIQRGLRGAVGRNRAKRLVRELYRQHKLAADPGRDVLVVIKRIDGLSAAPLKEEWIRLCQTLSRRSDLANA